MTSDTSFTTVRTNIIIQLSMLVYIIDIIFKIDYNVNYIVLYVISICVILIAVICMDLRVVTLCSSSLRRSL